MHISLLCLCYLDGFVLDSGYHSLFFIYFVRDFGYHYDSYYYSSMGMFVLIPFNVHTVCSSSSTRVVCIL